MEQLCLGVERQRIVGATLDRGHLLFSLPSELVRQKMEHPVEEEHYICKGHTHHRPVPKGLASFLVVEEVVRLEALLMIAASAAEAVMAEEEGLLEVQMMEVEEVVLR